MIGQYKLKLAKIMINVDIVKQVHLIYHNVNVK